MNARTHTHMHARKQAHIHTYTVCHTQSALPQVHAFDITTLKPKATIDLAAYGRVWSLIIGPYGTLLALAWAEGQVRPAFVCAVQF